MVVPFALTFEVSKNRLVGLFGWSTEGDVAIVDKQQE